MDIEFTNNIEATIEEYINRTGATKQWIADRLNISRQRLYGLTQAKNPNIITLIKLSFILNCKINDLYKYKIK